MYYCINKINNKLVFQTLHFTLFYSVIKKYTEENQKLILWSWCHYLFVVGS